MPTDRRWSDDDRELVKLAIADARFDDMSDEQAEAVLDALTAAGWDRADRVREQVAEEIAQHIEALDFSPAMPRLTRGGAAAIVRAHRTTPEAADG